MKAKRISLSLFMKLLLWIVFIAYSCCLLYWMFLGFHRSAQLDAQGYRYNIVPFQTIKMYLNHFHSFRFSTWVINVIGNIGVFIPFGILLPALFRTARKFFPFLRMFVTALLVLELLQMVSHAGSFDVDDLILNSFGAIGGYLMLGRRFR